MIATLVEFYLTDAGRQHFPYWVQQLATRAGAYPGFLDLRRLDPVSDSQRNLFLLTFDTIENTQVWARSPERAQLITDIQPYWRQPSTITQFTTCHPCTPPS